MNLWKLERIKNEKVQQWIMNLDLVGRTRLRKYLKLGNTCIIALNGGRSNNPPQKVIFSKSIKVPRSLLSFFILRQCMSIE
jgi:hypothetical protein